MQKGPDAEDIPVIASQEWGARDATGYVGMSYLNVNDVPLRQADTLVSRWATPWEDTDYPPEEGV